MVNTIATLCNQMLQLVINSEFKLCNVVAHSLQMVAMGNNGVAMVELV